ncbi:hypothetical protein OMW55_09520 [Sphingomonas sp. BN140010]|uniref:Uncharacterized protein n=1 Tax=Sphingomonas arvum TaxID=2992113 RepID=A0ABT3JGY9_9SPHN|nr:hypothetical protein [Sphingomonas sp. BN140010]MCW3798041.1 hypothetical protein [Sphingomonas sp. BN140010]
MRLLLPTAAALTLAACGVTPPQPATPVPVSRPQPEPVQRGDLIGFTVDELGARFGAPAFQVREGPGLKLQWSSPSCVLDTFLYPAPGTNVMRVTYVDSRRPTGDPADRTGCIAAIDAAG